MLIGVLEVGIEALELTVHLGEVEENLRAVAIRCSRP